MGPPPGARLVVTRAVGLLHEVVKRFAKWCVRPTVVATWVIVCLLVSAVGAPVPASADGPRLGLGQLPFYEDEQAPYA